MTSDPFNAMVSSQDPGLIVVTTAEAGEQAGCLVSFHSQSSIGPQRYCVWLSKANHTYRVALRSSHLAIHFLTSSDLCAGGAVREPRPATTPTSSPACG